MPTSDGIFVVEPEFDTLDEALDFVKTQPNPVGFQGYKKKSGKWSVTSFNNVKN